MIEYMEDKGFGENNELGDTILEFVLVFDLLIGNTFFKKEREALRYLSEWN